MGKGLPKTTGDVCVLEVLGEGWMTLVYLAQQERPIHRRVALMVIKLGVAPREVSARFESERQALALINHPHIAKVLDADTTTDIYSCLQYRADSTFRGILPPSLFSLTLCKPKKGFCGISTPRKWCRMEGAIIAMRSLLALLVTTLVLGRIAYQHN